MLLSESMLAVLAHSWDLCGRSWAALRPAWAGLAALGPYVGGLGPLSVPMLPLLGRSWDYVGAPEVLGGVRPKSAPNPSGSRNPKGAGPPSPPSALVLVPIVSVYRCMTEGARGQAPFPTPHGMAFLSRVPLLLAGCWLPVARCSSSCCD